MDFHFCPQPPPLSHLGGGIPRTGPAQPHIDSPEGRRKRRQQVQRESAAGLCRTALSGDPVHLTYFSHISSCVSTKEYFLIVIVCVCVCVCSYILYIREWVCLDSPSNLMVFFFMTIYIVDCIWKNQNFEWTHIVLCSKQRKCEITQIMFIV